MSSIDKYVEEYAKDINPKVKVTNQNGEIKGTINGEVVFRMPDRIGYLHSSDESIIDAGFRLYKRRHDEEERRRLEEERRRREEEARRLEEQRKAEYNRFISIIESKKNEIKKAEESALNELNKKKIEISNINVSINGYNLKRLEERKSYLIFNTEQEEQNLKRAFNDKIVSLDELRKLNPSADINTIKNSIHRANNISSFVNHNFNNQNISDLINDYNNIKNAIVELEKVKIDINKFSNIDKELVSITLKEIENFEIATTKDVDKLISIVKGNIESIKDKQFNSELKEASNNIKALDGILKTCNYIRDYVINQNYEKHDFSKEINELIDRVLNAYNELKNNEYTTCSESKFEAVYSQIQKIISSGNNDELSLNLLKELYRDYKEIKSNDELLLNDFDQYKELLDELNKNNISTLDYEEFDVGNSKEQIRNIKSILEKKDYEKANARTIVKFVNACKVMEEMGYKMVYYNTGNENDEVIACEAFYAIPGCEGVGYKIVTSDIAIGRKLCGITRNSTGLSTSNKRVLEVARVLDQKEEPMEFLKRYYEESGEAQLEVKNAVESYTNNCEEFIEEAFVLNDIGEKTFDNIVSSGTIEQRRMFETNIKKEESTVVRSTNINTSTRERFREETVKRYQRSDN